MAGWPCYDADWFREALKDKGLKPCIPGRTSRGKAIKHDRGRHERRNRVEIMFGRLEDWQRVAARYDRCPKVLLSAAGLTRDYLWRSAAVDDMIAAAVTGAQMK